MFDIREGLTFRKERQGPMILRKWRYTVDLRQYLDDDADFRDVARKIAARIERSKQFERGSDYFADDLRTMAEDPRSREDDMEAILARIYDYADEHRIFLGEER